MPTTHQNSMPAGKSAEPATMPDMVPRTTPPGGQWQRYDPREQPRFDRRRPDGLVPGFGSREEAWPGEQPTSQAPRPSFEPPQDPRQPYDPPNYPQPPGYGAWPYEQSGGRYPADGRNDKRGPFEPLQPPAPYPSAPAVGQPFPAQQPPTWSAPGMQPPGMQPPGMQPPGMQPPDQQLAGSQPPWALIAPGQPAPGQPAAGQRPPGQKLRPPKPKRGKRRVVTTVAVVVVLLLAVGAAGGGYLLLRTHGSPSQTATSYLAAWQRGDYNTMGQVSLNPGGLASMLAKTKAELGVRQTHLTLGQVTITGSTAQARFTATDDLASGHVWTYQGQLSLVVAKRHWWVNWSPSAIYPGLKPGERFALSAEWPTRAPILADDGTVLSSPEATAQSGSLSMLTGYVGPATASEARKLGAPYRKGDVIGLSGIEATYQSQLAGRPSLTVKIVGPGKRVDGTATRFAARLGTPVKTSINMAAQVAASVAVSSAKTKKPVDLVAMQASTGRVLAVVERPGGYDRALQGIFPPGSTFKVVTASALAKVGLTPSSSVQCPSHITINGRTFHNDKNEHLGTTNLQTAFAVSCNSTFALLATQQLSGTSLGSMARVFGFNATPELGIPASLGHFSTPHDQVDLAADAFGQGLDLVNPLSQASEVAAIDSGAWRPPLLVVSPRPHQKFKPHVLSAAILNTLRPMMLAVVTSGTAAGVGLPAGTYGKTGTAEYGTGPHPNAHGWFIGYKGDIAFAVLVEGGGYGANSAGPIANSFLRKLGA